MTDPERITQLEAELARLRTCVRELLAENAALKRRLGQDSHNGSKPPASDGLARRRHPVRRPSGKKPGGQVGQVGQVGHDGHTLKLVAPPMWCRCMLQPPVTTAGSCSRGLPETVAEERRARIAQYHEVLASGFAANAPLVSTAAPRTSRQRGRSKQPPAKNLQDALLRRSDRVLAFLDDLTVPFTNNQAERDLRMATVQQKIAGTFRSPTGAAAFCRLRRYRSTMRKQGHALLGALVAVLGGKPLPIAWSGAP
jgi:hypothetical protein